MSRGAYYNENEPYAAQWLRNLVAAGHIAPGDVDERSIVDVRADDIRGYRQCHFFAGVGVWSYALRLAGWPDDESVWTGSCPCQPFSQAGGRRGFDDERHYWPNWQGLIEECRPHPIFGEQVADQNGLAWLDFVCADLEAAGYAIGAVDTSSAGFGAPHIRQRLFFVADSKSMQFKREPERGFDPSEICLSGTHTTAQAGRGSGASPLAYPQSERRGEARPEHRARPEERLDNGSEHGALAYAGSEGSPEQRGRRVESEGSPTAGFWRDCEWVYHRDAKWRPTEPGTFPLAHGATERVGRLRAYGNAIVAPVAAEFIRAYLDVRAQCL